MGEKGYFTVNELADHFFFLALLPVFGSILKKTPESIPSFNLSSFMTCPLPLPQRGHFSVSSLTNGVTLLQLKQLKAGISFLPAHMVYFERNLNLLAEYVKADHEKRSIFTFCKRGLLLLFKKWRLYE